MNVLNKTVLFNSLWMMAEKIISIFGMIFVTAFVAKYIGPENFGKITFAASIFAIVQTIAMFGLSDIIFQKASKNRKIGEKIIYSTILIRNILFFSVSPFVIIWIYFNTDWLTFIFSIASCISAFFALHDVYGIYFNAILMSKINAICNTIGLLLAFAIRYLIPYFQLDMLWLSVPIITVTMIPFLMRMYFYKKMKLSNLDSYKTKTKLIRNHMLGIGKKLFLYSLSVAIFTKTSQLFLGISSQYDLGIYTVAMTLGFGFAFVVGALISSVMVQIYVEPDFELSQKKVAQLNAITIVICMMILFFLLIMGKWIILWLYGYEYLAVNDILWIMGLVCLFSNLSTIAEKYMLKFNAYSYLQKKINLLLLFNIVITFFMIRFYGLYGAASAILITEIFTTTVFNYFFKNGIILDVHKRIFSTSTYF